MILCTLLNFSCWFRLPVRCCGGVGNSITMVLMIEPIFDHDKIFLRKFITLPYCCIV
ncbi:hypothetical protein M758_4G106900 [Ceratodon purpureus]|nr:hypothetical protein M758_4G106900 [Ceratodon purpureus]